MCELVESDFNIAMEFPVNTEEFHVNELIMHTYTHTQTYNTLLLPNRNVMWNVFGATKDRLATNT